MARKQAGFYSFFQVYSQNDVGGQNKPCQSFFTHFGPSRKICFPDRLSETNILPAFVPARYLLRYGSRPAPKNRGDPVQ